MEVKVKLSNLRTAPQKVRLAADLVRGKTLIQAQSILLFTVSKPAKSILKLLNSAAASAKNDLHLDQSNLFVSKITVDEGPKLKRWHPMSRGRAYPIIKRTSHIVLTLSEKVLAEKKKTEAVKSEVQNPKSEAKPKVRISKPKAKKAKK